MFLNEWTKFCLHFINILACKEGKGSYKSIEKSFTFQVTKHKTSSEYYLDIGITVFIIFVFSILMFAVSRHHFQLTLSSNKNISSSQTRVVDDNVQQESGKKYPIFLDEMCKKENNQISMHQQNELYIWLVVIMGICYCIPAVQLVGNQTLGMKGN